MRLRIYYRWTVILKIRNGKTKPIRAKTYTGLLGKDKDDALRSADQAARTRGAKIVLEPVAMQIIGIAFAFDLDDRDRKFDRDELWATDPNNPAAALLVA